MHINFIEKFSWDMLDSARTILKFTSGIDYSFYLNDRKLQLAVERGIEIMGEAAGRVSETFKQSHPEVPWRAIISQRNFIIHEYGEISQERIWELVDKHIPELVSMLKPLIPSPPE